MGLVLFTENKKHRWDDIQTIRYIAPEQTLLRDVKMACTDVILQEKNNY